MELFSWAKGRKQVLACTSTRTETGAAGSKWERQKLVHGAGLVAPTRLAWPWQLHFASSGRGMTVLKSDSETKREVEEARPWGLWSGFARGEPALKGWHSQCQFAEAGIGIS